MANKIPKPSMKGSVCTHSTYDGIADHKGVLEVQRDEGVGHSSLTLFLLYQLWSEIRECKVMMDETNFGIADVFGQT